MAEFTIRRTCFRTSLTLACLLSLTSHVQAQSPPNRGTLEDPRIDVGGENPVYGKRRLTTSYDWQDLREGETLQRIRLRMQHPFGTELRYAWQIEVPFENLRSGGESVARGLSDIGTRLSWTFYRTPQLRQSVSLNLQWESAQDDRLGDNATLLQPQYAFSYARSETLVLNGRLTYARSIDRDRGAPVVNRLTFEPSVTFLLPERWSCALATRLGWNFERHKLAARVKGTLGFILGEKQQWEFDAFVEQALTDLARRTQFERSIGVDLLRYF
mgnify:CR=1 FL=1